MFTHLGNMDMATEVKIPGIFPLDLGIFTFPLCPVTPFSSCTVSPIFRAEQRLCHYSFVPKYFFPFVLLGFF